MKRSKEQADKTEDILRRLVADYELSANRMKWDYPELDEARWHLEELDKQRASKRKR